MALIRLFDYNEGAVVPTEHCYILKSLKDIVDAHPEDYLKRLAYVYYMTCPDPDQNPFFNVQESEKSELIFKEIDADFSLDDILLDKAIEFCNSLYDTPTKRAYNGIKVMMDRLASFFQTHTLSTGRDGSLTAVVAAASKYKELRDTFKSIEKDYKDEIKELARGDAFTAYDQQ